MNSKTPLKGSSVVMPEPTQNDVWEIGGWQGRVVDIRENGNLVVKDVDGDCFEVEPQRVEVV